MVNNAGMMCVGEGAVIVEDKSRERRKREVCICVKGRGEDLTEKRGR